METIEIAKKNLRHNSLLSIAAAVMLCLLTPLLIGTANLDLNSAAMPLEMFVSLIGIVLLTPVFQPEQNEEIHDLVCSKYCNIGKVYLIRTLYSVVVVILLICLFTVYMQTRGSDVTIILVFGTVANATFLGSMGMLTSALTGNTVIGYMPPFLYYALNIGMGPKLGSFYLFSMTVGNFRAKIWLLAAGVLMIMVSLFSTRIFQQRT
ncbi:MAG: hypothetical protein HFG37_04705 [Eubacterium sp.]|nr:hypothetical protein [Eubacterium sp.]MCI9411965.1 hypothetical protein [Eubacterium sp.]